MPPALRAHDIDCGELGAPESERWGAPVHLLKPDRDAVEALAGERVLELEPGADGVRIAGRDQIGFVVLPSGRQIRIRPKVPGLVLLDWMAYLNECPPVPSWARGAPGFGPGGSVHGLLAAVFVAELDKLTRTHLRKEFAPAQFEAAAVRGRIRGPALARACHRLPKLPQSGRVRTLDTPHHGLLAAALDRVGPLLPAGDAGSAARAAALGDTWAGVVRRDLAAAPPDGGGEHWRWGCPPGYGPAVQLASVILYGSTPASRPPPPPPPAGPAFLLSVARLWERAVRRLCRDLAGPTGWRSVPDAGRTRRWHDTAAGDAAAGPADPEPRARWMTADVLLAAGERRWVLDAKYKRDFGNEDRADRFQTAAYTVAFDAGRGSLVYPTAAGPAADRRVLLSGQVRGKPVTIDSVDLPMAAGPLACAAALLDVVRSAEA